MDRAKEAYKMSGLISLFLKATFPGTHGRIVSMSISVIAIFVFSSVSLLVPLFTFMSILFLTSFLYLHVTLYLFYLCFHICLSVFSLSECLLLTFSYIFFLCHCIPSVFVNIFFLVSCPNPPQCRKQHDTLTFPTLE